MGNWCLTATCRQYISRNSTHKTQSAVVAQRETAWRCDTEAVCVRDPPPEIGTGVLIAPMPRPQSVGREQTNKQPVEENQERRRTQLRKHNFCPYNDVTHTHTSPLPIHMSCITNQGVVYANQGRGFRRGWRPKTKPDHLGLHCAGPAEV